MNKDKVKNLIEETLRRLPISFNSVEVTDEEDTGSVRFAVKTGESDILIGREGATLHAINHIVRRMVEQTEGEGKVNFYIDINDYQRNKMDELRQKAKMMAERARFFKSSVELEPMSSYERMVVHSFIAPFADLTTESSGVGPNRHVIIRYKEIDSI